LSNPIKSQSEVRSLLELKIAPKTGFSSAGQRTADARDHGIPLTFLGCRVVDQHAVYEALSEVATVVPNFAVAEAGHHEESRCHPLVYNVRGWIFLC
jgi:hypothetical protein